MSEGEFEVWSMSTPAECVRRVPVSACELDHCNHDTGIFSNSSEIKYLECGLRRRHPVREILIKIYAKAEL